MEGAVSGWSLRREAVSKRWGACSRASNRFRAIVVPETMNWDAEAVISDNERYEAVRICRSASSWRPCAGVACGAHDETGDGDLRGRPAALRPCRAALAVERSSVVPGAGQRHGDGLALLWNNDVGAGRLEAGAEPTCGG